MTSTTTPILGLRLAALCAPAAAMPAQGQPGAGGSVAANLLDPFGPGYDLTGLEGLMVEGSRGERLGYILAVDQAARMVQLQTPGGVAIAMPLALLSEKGDHLVARNLSRADVLATAGTQTGRSVALTIDRAAGAGRA